MDWQKCREMADGIRAKEGTGSWYPASDRNTWPTFSGAPRPVQCRHVGRSPGSRVVTLFCLPRVNPSGISSEKYSPPTVAGAASVGNLANWRGCVEFPLSFRIPTQIGCHTAPRTRQANYGQHTSQTHFSVPNERKVPPHQALMTGLELTPRHASVAPQTCGHIRG